MPKILDFAERLFVILLVAPFLVSFAKALPTHPQFILMAISELMTAAFILTRKPGEIAATPYAFFVALTGTMVTMLLRPSDLALAPLWLTTGLMIAGLAISVSAKAWLNRSFGVVAANRGVKDRGPYRAVRHPMYAGYVVTQIGFMLASFSVANLVVLSIGWTFQLLRIREEERLLSGDPAYRAYSSRVPYRLAPGLF